MATPKIPVVSSRTNATTTSTVRPVTAIGIPKSSMTSVTVITNNSPQHSVDTSSNGNLNKKAVFGTCSSIAVLLTLISMSGGTLKLE